MTSRFYDCDSYDGPDTSGLWRSAYYRAEATKRGEAFLRELKAALLAVPGHRLIEGSWCAPDGEVCALGAVAVRRIQEAEGLPWSEAARKLFEELPSTETGEYSTWEAVHRFGIQKTIATEVAVLNDEGYGWATAGALPRQVFGATEERQQELRWQRLYAWVCGRLGEDASADPSGGPQNP